MVQDGIGPHFLGWLDSLGDGAIAVIAHKNGDMDTIASATVLASMIALSRRSLCPASSTRMCTPHYQRYSHNSPF